MFLSKRKSQKPSRIVNQYLFARAFFKNVRSGISIGIIQGRKQVREYMRGSWWNNDPVETAAKVHDKWGGIGKL